MVIVITSGYFDPLHVGHLEYLHKAKLLGSLHVCIVNNDRQAAIKKGKSFMREDDRCNIIQSLKDVDVVILSIDTDATVCKTLEMIRQKFPQEYLIFAKGGDRHKDEIPEADTCKKLGIYITEGLGDKIRSSSNFINEIKAMKED